MYEKQQYAGSVGPMIDNARAYQNTAVLPDMPRETVNQLVELIAQQVTEAAQRSAGIAQILAGPVPANGEAGKEPGCLIDYLKIISRTMSITLSELERAQRSL